MPTGKLPVYPQPGNEALRIPRGAPQLGALIVVGPNPFFVEGPVKLGGTLTAKSQLAATLLGNPGTVAAVATTIPLAGGLSFNAGGSLQASGAIISSIGAGLTLLAGGTLEAYWQGGLVVAVNTGLAINSDTLQAQWNAGAVIAHGAGIQVNSGTLMADWQGGPVATFSSGVTVAPGSGELSVEWNAGTVNAIGGTLVITSDTLHN